MRVNYTIDWLRYTASMLGDGSRMVPEASIFELSEHARPAPFYEFGAQMVAGRLDWCSDGLTMPHMATFTGQDLIIVRRVLGEMALLRHAAKLNRVNVTRLDFAIDIYDGFSPDDFEARFNAGRVQSPARKMTVIESKEGGKKLGKTVYIGSRSSNKMLRVYDKGKQTGKHERWTRVELELKQEPATMIMLAMVAHGIRDAGCAAIRGFAYAPEWDDWEQITRGSVEVDTTIGRKDTNHERWLKQVVFPNFERAVREGNPDALRLLDEWHNEFIAESG